MRGGGRSTQEESFVSANAGFRHAGRRPTPQKARRSQSALPLERLSCAGLPPKPPCRRSESTDSACEGSPQSRGRARRGPPPSRSPHFAGPRPTRLPSRSSEGPECSHDTPSVLWERESLCTATGPHPTLLPQNLRPNRSASTRLPSGGLEFALPPPNPLTLSRGEPPLPP